MTTGIRLFDNLALLTELRRRAHEPSEYTNAIRNLITLFMDELNEAQPRGVTHIYVDGTNGDDESGDGTQGNPFATGERALFFVPTVLDGDYVVHFAEGTYSVPSLEREFFCGAFRLALVGEGYEVIDSGTLTGFTNTTGNPWLLTDGSKAWTPEEHIVRFLRLTSGAAAGSLLNVIENDATTIRTSGAFVNAAIGDSYEIVRPAVRLEGFDVIGGSETFNGIQVYTSSSAFARDAGGLTLVNLDIAGNLVGTVISGFVQAYGLLLSAGLSVHTALAGYPTDFSFLQSDVISQGQGAGIIADTGSAIRLQGDFAGVLNAESIQIFISGPASGYQRANEIIAGRFWAETALGCVAARYPGFLRMGLPSTSADNYGRVLIRPALGGTIADGIQVALGGIANVDASVVIECTDVGSVGVRVRGPASKLVLEGTPTIDGAARGILVEGGAAAQMEGNGSGITTAGANTAAVEANGTTADTGGAGAFTTDLNFVTAASGDGSTIHRVDD